VLIAVQLFFGFLGALQVTQSVFGGLDGFIAESFQPGIASAEQVNSSHGDDPYPGGFRADVLSAPPVAGEFWFMGMAQVLLLTPPATAMRLMALSPRVVIHEQYILALPEPKKVGEWQTKRRV
jgi:hypothetical protein